jgi:glycosyltransferase involved in cell wall biosynthesis
MTGSTVHLLFFSDIPWNALYQRPQHLATRLARRWPVLWIEPATLHARASFAPIPIGENLTALSLPVLPHNARYKPLRTLSWMLGRAVMTRHIVERAQAVLLHRAMRRLEIDSGKLGILVENFQFIGLIRHLSPLVTLFDYIDDAFGFTHLPAYVREEWRETIRRADYVTATSPTLKRQLEAAGARGVEVVSNGVEYDLFAGEKGDRPTDLPAGPIIGYIGSVYPWLDYELIGQVAHANPDAHVVMIGHAHPEVRKGLDALAAHPNFHFLGAKPYREVPRYLRHFSVAIIPFRKTTLTVAVNPVKLYEQSAAGIPTVATDFSRDLEELGALVSIGRSHEEFLSLVRASLSATGDPDLIARLRTFAGEHDWDKQAGRLIALLEERISQS